MPYGVTRSCCADASCVLACPVNCIHPAPGEPGFAEAEMLYVDPRACVDCGACTTACPVGALKPHTKLTDHELPFLELNAAYYADDPHPACRPLALVPKQRPVSVPIRVAIVGAGPAGLYTADELLKHAHVTVDVFDRLPTPYGLVRSGVAPDHEDTKLVTGLYRAIEQQPGFSYVLNVEVGTDVLHEELAASYDAVVYTVGASTDRVLGIEGEELPGCSSATALVAWYNGHPDASQPVSLDTERVVVVGNGNVALDVARVLTTYLDTQVREVVLLGRRSAAEAAFTLPELIGLASHHEVDVVVEGHLDLTSPKAALLAALDGRPRDPSRRRIVLRFETAPVRIVGTDRVTGLETSSGDVIETAVVLRSVGYRGRPVDGLPFDAERCVVPNERGRVAAGVYVAGWIKRGPSGFIGTNKSCAEETVASLLDDLDAGLLPAPTRSHRDLLACVPWRIDLDGWQRIDRLERETGTKLTDRLSLVQAARRRPSRTRSTRRQREPRGATVIPEVSQTHAGSGPPSSGLM